MNDADYMKRALKLARYGKGKVSPNPCVGAVIVRGNSIIGEGYHKAFGKDHAEVDALKKARGNTEGATMYCTLEPCIHRGKTPPCVDAIIDACLKRVVIGMTDPNPVVNGRGVALLRSKGIEVKTGILEDEVSRLNEPYRKFITTGIPYVTLKMAQAINGKITFRTDTRTNITGEEAGKYVHRLRSESDAVLVGKRTAIIDNPLLTPRLIKGRIPLRIVLDTRLTCDPALKIFETAGSGPVCIATSAEDSVKKRPYEDKGISFIHVKKEKSGYLDMSDLLKKLGQRNIASLLVEGGSEVAGSFLRNRLADLIVILIAPVFFGEGVDLLNARSVNGMPPLKLGHVSLRKLGRDVLIEGKPLYGQEEPCLQE
ncbi:bifunctional diaminohydroxyphosphoribosylaminopyrimidine deaminase/5-amino-6-(5-phosphoribosylamino)uracil reductase RibD [candidate division KSB1 bacterium]